MDDATQQIRVDTGLYGNIEECKTKHEAPNIEYSVVDTYFIVLLTVIWLVM